MEDWKKDLNELFNKKEIKEQQNEEKMRKVELEVKRFYSSIVNSAFQEIKSELEKHDRKVEVYIGKKYASITVKFQRIEELIYSVKVYMSPRGASPYPEIKFIDAKDKKRSSAIGQYGISSNDYDITNITKEIIIKDFLRQYKPFIFKSI